MSDSRSSTALSGAPSRRRIRLCYFNQWAGPLAPAADYLARVPSLDLRPLVADPRDRELLRKARLDCDWYAANTRCFASMRHDRLDFLPAWVAGPKAVLDLARAPREAGEERWLITMAHQPQQLGDLAGKVFAFLTKAGVRHGFYAFDEASRFMPCFNDIAPHLDVLIHDESPLADPGQATDERIARGFPPLGEFNLRLWIDVSEIGAVGYRLYLFYP